MVRRHRLAYSRRMPKPDDVHATYACMMKPEHLRRIHQPHDERPAILRNRVRRALTKLAAAVRT
jgi:hypothetical protein